MGKGRKRTPPHLQVVKGADRADRANEDMPEVSEDLPVAPPTLNDEEVHHFNRLVSILEEQGLASASHVDVIVALARRLAEIDMYSKVIDEQGPSYETFTNSGGRMVRMRPEIAARSESLRHMHGLLAEIGLTPASMSKVSAKPKAKANPFQKLG